MHNIEKLIQLEKEANDFGFSWEQASQIMAQIRSECDEINVHLQDGNQEKLQEEIGDLLHAVYSLCVFCHLDPFSTLDKSIDKFALRLAAVKQIAKKQGLTSLQGKSFAELMIFWEQAKRITN